MVPSAAVNLVSSGQPMIVYNIRRLLNQDKAKKDAVTRKIGAPSTYQELLAVAQKGGASGGFKGDIVEIFGDPSGSTSSSQLKASTIDRSKVPAANAAPSSRPRSHPNQAVKPINNGHDANHTNRHRRSTSSQIHGSNTRK